MIMRFFWLSLALCCLGLCAASVVHPAAEAARDEPHRSPVAIALLPDGRYAVTANQTADSISLVDLQSGKVLDEKRSGRKPAAVACTPDGKLAVVANLWSANVSFFAIDKATLKPAGTMSVGSYPSALAMPADGKALYVAVAGNDEVVRIDLPGRNITHRLATPRYPERLALSPDGQYLAVACSRAAQVVCWNIVTGKLHWQRKIEDAFNLHGLSFTPDGKNVIVAHTVRREFPVSRSNIEVGWVVDNRLTRLALDAEAVPFSWQIALDTRGQAIGDPHGLAMGKDLLVLAAAGTHELLLLKSGAIPWNAADPGDFLDFTLAGGDQRMRRIDLGGRPMGITLTADASRAIIANYLLDAIQIVDLQAGKLQNVIPLGSPSRPSLERQGEAIFYDARRSHHQWFSCHTCHVDGHTCGLTFDTLNDDSYGNPKLTPSLRGVVHTGPWTWHGWQKELSASVEKSLTQTMFGPQPTPHETKAVIAFLATLEHPPNPHAIKDGPTGEAARQGRNLFLGKARCARCHQGDHYTSEVNYDVKLEPDGSPHTKWNPPTLRGLSDRGPFMHDGRAKTLDDLLEKHHIPEKLGGDKLTPDERRELIQFLRTL